MAVATWNTPSAQGANIASTTLDSLANGSTSAFVTYDNSSNLDLYANIEVDLGSFTSTSGANILLRIHSTANAGASVPDDTGSVGGGEVYPYFLTVGASAKLCIFPMVRLYPFSLRIQITNFGGAAFAASSNAIKVQPYNEKVV
jgi:hypothetical protein